MLLAEHKKWLKMLHSINVLVYKLRLVSNRGFYLDSRV
jgi:hypothetical protein